MYHDLIQNLILLILPNHYNVYDLFQILHLNFLNNYMVFMQIMLYLMNMLH